MALNAELLKILACPRCKKPVALSDDQSWLLCPPCGLRYPIKDDIPIMLTEEAQPLEG
jgi:hypothetical protein